MTQSLKKYWWILIVFIIIPLIVNVIVLFPNNIIPVAGNQVAWIGFFACYFGSVISAFISFAILFKTIQFNQLENERNRKLQNKIILYQIGHDNLKSFIEASNLFCRTLNYNTLVEIANIFVLDSKSPLNRIKQEFANTTEAERLSNFYIIAEPSKHYLKLIQEQEKALAFYNSVLLDLEVVTTYLNCSTDYIKQHILTDEHSSTLLREIISQNYTSLDTDEPKVWLNKILNKRIQAVNPKFLEKTWNLISKVHFEEIMRLKSLISENDTEQDK